MHIRMAHQMEFKEINREDYKDSFELSQREVCRLSAANRELVLGLAKLNKKLGRRRPNWKLRKRI